MHRHLTLLAFVLYLALDLSNPFVAGAFNFDPDECVEAAQREQRTRVTVDDAIPSLQLLGTQQVKVPRIVRHTAAPVMRPEWRASSVVVHAVPSSSPSPTEDH